jgi:hypothetical protein
MNKLDMIDTAVREALGEFLVMGLEETENGNAYTDLINIISALMSVAAAEARNNAVWNQRWRLIETAPKDGTPVLLGWEGVTSLWKGRWVRGMRRTHDRWDIPGLGIGTLKPTHWMPLPEPPQ